MAQCNYSNTDIDIKIEPNIPVECPTCGAVVTIPLRNQYEDGITFPAHKPGRGKSTQRRYKEIDGTWAIIGGGMKRK
jgi:hypothetical protein